MSINVVSVLVIGNIFLLLCMLVILDWLLDTEFCYQVMIFFPLKSVGLWSGQKWNYLWINLILSNLLLRFRAAFPLDLPNLRSSIKVYNFLRTLPSVLCLWRFCILVLWKINYSHSMSLQELFGVLRSSQEELHPPYMQASTWSDSKWPLCRSQELALSSSLLSSTQPPKL